MFTNAPSLRAVALASMVILGACSKSNDDPTPTPATTYGSSWTADSKNYTGTTNSYQVSSGTLSLNLTQASTTESNSIGLSVPAATGTYNLASATGNTLALYSTTVGTTSAAYLGTSGTVTVTTYSATEIIGTFSFSASTLSSPSVTKAISNGKFSIKR